MKTIRIKNLRSLKDTGDIAINKLSVLVGNNSSGKSTLLRVFPLLKQTCNNKINGPVLWSGDDDDYVDFGSFREALSINSRDKSIHFSFDFCSSLNVFRYIYRNRDRDAMLHDIHIDFSIKHNKDTGYDYISKVKLAIDSQRTIVCFSGDGLITKLTHNGKEISISTNKGMDYYWIYDQPLFEVPLGSIWETARMQLISLFMLEENDSREISLVEEYADYIVANKIFGKDTEGKINDRKISELEEIYNSGNSKEINKWSYLFMFRNYYSIATNYLRSYFMNVYYIAPVRATAERYYKLRNSSVNEVDCRGKNLPIFLNSLSPKEFSQFQAWTRTNLGFIVTKSVIEGHVSLLIKRGAKGKEINISDTGFGYSQLLPIATQIWYISKRKKRIERDMFDYGTEIPVTVIIEQPELHLHPALQAKLIDIVTSVADRENIHFIIETHSETMINRIGASIGIGNIRNADVGIYIFNKEIEGNTIISKSGFDEEGYLENWPIGFFDPDWR